MMNVVFETIPSPEVIEHHGDMPTDFADPPAVSSLRPATDPDPKHLAHFQTLMAHHRWTVKVPRMLMDCKYACDRIALAHMSPNPELRVLAQRLFKVFQARGARH